MTPWMIDALMVFQSALFFGSLYERKWGLAVFWIGCFIANAGVKIMTGGKG